MQHCFILLVFLIVFMLNAPPALLAQQFYTASDSIGIYKLLDRADHEDFEGNLDAALNTAETALLLSRKVKMKRGEGFANLKIADIRLKQGDTSGLHSFYSEGERLGRVLKDSFLLGLTYNQMAQYDLSQNDYTKAFNNLQYALECYKAAGQESYIAYIYNELGFISDRQGHYEYAVDYYLKSIRIREQLREEIELVNTLNNLAIVYFRLGNKEEAMRIFKDCLQRQQRIGDVKRVATTAGNLVVLYQTTNIDSALLFQNIAVEYAELTGVKSIIANAYQGKALLLKKQGLYLESMQFDQKAIEMYDGIGNKEKLVARYSSIADTYDLLGDTLNAVTWYNKAEQLAIQLNNKPLLQDLFLALANFYKRKNRLSEAFGSLQIHYSYKDSLISEKTKSAISELQLKYETEKKDFEIERLNTAQRIKQLEIEKQKAIIAGNKLEAQKKQNEINLLQQRQKLNEAIFLQQKDAYEKQVLKVKSQEQVLQLTQQNLQLSKQEKELQHQQIQKQKAGKLAIAAFGILSLAFTWLFFNRSQLKKSLDHQKSLYLVRNNIAKDLHDEIGSTLSSIAIMSSLSQQSLEQAPKQTKEMLQDISTQSQYIQQKMSDIVWAIRPDNEKIEALSARMREFTSKTLEPLNIAVSFDVDESLMNNSLEVETRKEVLLIFKESVNNIVKHADANQVKIRWEKEGHLYCLTIADNGSWKGPETGASGTGLKSMKERAEGIGGSLKIETAGQGTRLILRLPLT